MDADREKHLDRYKVLVGCSLSRSNQAKESGRVGRPASWGVQHLLCMLDGVVRVNECMDIRH
jgi:hypothetical protein